MPRFVTSDGSSLYYRLQGKTSGQLLILLHGWCSNLDHWSLLIKRLARSHRILCIDRRGMGRSATSTGDQSALRHAKDVAEIAESLALGAAVVVSHAGGGPSALELCRRYPGLIRAAVFIDSLISPPARIGDPQDSAGMAFAGMIDALAASDGKDALQKMYAGYFSQYCDPQLVKQVVDEAIKTPLAVAIDELRDLAGGSEAMAGEVGQQVLWLSVAEAPQAYIRQHLHRVQFGQVVGSGHFPQLEVPAQTCAMIETFIGQIDS